MNILKGEIASLKVQGALSLVMVAVSSVRLSTIVIDTPETVSYLRVGNTVKVIFKETEVIIGKGTSHNISLQNKLAGTIRSVESGEILSKLVLDTVAGEITSIITANAVSQLELKEGTAVTAMIKTNEIMLSE